MESINIATYSSGLIDITTVTEFSINDIAHGLSNICRFNGQCRQFYSVAEHSVNCSDFAKPEHKLQALLHDASEAYIADLTSPVKNNLGKEYKYLEKDLMIRIFRYFNIYYPYPKEVKIIDGQMFATEVHQLFDNVSDFDLKYLPFDMNIRCLKPRVAKTIFLYTYYQLKGYKFELREKHERNKFKQ